MLMRTCLALVVVSLAAPTAGVSAPPHLRVLFVGNSLTAANDLPARVQAIARSIGEIDLEVGSYTPGGYALEDHWTDGTARAMVEAGGWDVVVFQQGPSSLPSSGANLRAWTATWARDVRAHGGRPVLLTVWPERGRGSALASVIQNYRAAAVASRTGLFPAGVAWSRCLAVAPRIRLYGPDGFHPAPMGTYLAALVVYSGLVGHVPAGLPAVPVAVGRSARATVHGAAVFAFAASRRA
ncbi:MAG: hypothetical protein ACTHKS_10740 [Gaiellaceae bacterium]